MSCGAVVSAPAVVLSLVLGWNLTATALAITTPAVVYTMFGGVQAVTWTDVKIMALIVFGLFAMIAAAVLGLPDSVSLADGLGIAAATGRLRSFDFSFDLTNQYTFWSGTIAALFLFCSYFGTDQSQVQRYLTARSEAEAKQSLLMSAYWKIPLQVVVLLLGVFVFVFYVFTRPPLLFTSAQEERLRQGEAAPAYAALQSEFDAAFEARRAAGLAFAVARDSQDDRHIAAAEEMLREQEAAVEAVREKATMLVKQTTNDQTFTDVNYIIPTFILTQLPVGLIGLLIVAILMAATDTIAGELNSLSTATVIDFYRRRFRHRGVGGPLPGGVEDRHRPLGPVCLWCGRMGSRARLAHRGGEPLRVVLLRVDSRRVHPGGRRPARHGQWRLHRPHRRDGIRGMGGQLHERRIPLAQRHRRARRRHCRARRERDGPRWARAESCPVIVGKFVIVLVVVIVVFWMIGGLLRDRTRRR